MTAEPAKNWGIVVARSLAIVLFALATIRVVALLGDPFGERFLGNDLNGYLAGARRFLETGSPFAPEQLSGSWQLQPDSFIHPPVALILFVPFLVLPAPAWWLIPVLLTVAALHRLRPAAWSWPLMAACLLWPRTAGVLIAGNTDLWVTAAIAVSLAWAVPTAVLLVMKPSYLPLALIGAAWKSWWIAGAAVSVVCLAFGGLWFDYVTVLRGVSVEPWYSLLNVPYVSIPLIAWLARGATAPTSARAASWIQSRATRAGT